MIERNGKLALFLPSLRGGGAERVAVNLAGGLLERGHSVDLVLVKAEGPYLKDVPTSIRIIDLDASRTLFSLTALIRYLQEARPDGLISFMGHANLIALLALLLARSSCKCVATIHNTTPTGVTKVATTVKLTPRFASRFLYERATAIVAVSAAVADHFSRSAGIQRDRIQVIFNPVITPALISQAEEKLDHPWFAPGQPPVIIAIGRLTPQKDYPTLIRAFKLLCRDKCARLLVLGEGEERVALQTMIEAEGLKDAVSLPGFVDNPYRFLKAAAVFVLPSRWEGLPTVLIEAAALSTPVVATNCPGSAEILREHEDLLVPVGDEVALASALCQTLAQPRAPDLDTTPYSLSFATAQYVNLFGFE